ncbi:MAG: phosphoribosylformylglycinamidine synthase, partial [Verrucomicrobia bacterium]|nr:phosphoribosylformylglycinamidine synthase [Verrucomicrobiota bacterium]
MQPILLQGRPAFSEFRIASLTNALNETIPEHDIARIDAVEVYLIESEAPLDDETTRRAFTLLGAEKHFERQNQLGGFFVTPRKGTISPWSSKATDIFHNCELSHVARVERGIHYILTTETGLVLSAVDLGMALLALHDRMTEGVYENLGDFFQHPEPAPLRTVPLMAEGPEAFARANMEWGLALSPEEIDYLVAA